jgi:hypothetical protein
MNFFTPINRARAILTQSHAIGDGVLVVDNGSVFGSPSSSSPIKISATVNNVDVIFSVIGRSGNTLTIGSVIEGTSDINIPSGIAADIRFTARDLTDIHTTLIDMDVRIASAGAVSGTRLVTGGSPVWTSGYTWMMSYATYYINGTLYSSNPQSVTLDAADPTNGRFDLLVLDSSGSFAKVTGTASPQPSVPIADPQTQLVLTQVFVDSGSTSPSTVSNTIVYDENTGTPTEWATSSSGTGWALASSTSAYIGSVAINATSVANGAYVQFQVATPLDVSTKGALVFYIKSKAAWASTKSMTISFMASGVLKGTSVSLAQNSFGFNSSNTTSFQQIAIPISNFGVAAGTTVNQLRFAVSGTGTNIGFYLDDVFLQTNAVGTTPDGLTQDQSDARYARRALNLSDLTDVTIARASLGLNSMAVQSASSVAITGGSLTGVSFGSHAGTVATATDGATVTLNCAASDWHELTLGGNRTIALSGDVNGQQIALVLKQPGSGGPYTVTWFSGILWAGGTPPTLTSTASKRDVVTFKRLSSGVYLGFVAGQNF